MGIGKPIFSNIKAIRFIPAQYHKNNVASIISMAREIGSNDFHVRDISWSYRIRGRVPRIHRNRKARADDFIVASSVR